VALTPAALLRQLLSSGPQDIRMNRAPTCFLTVFAERAASICAQYVAAVLPDNIRRKIERTERQPVGCRSASRAV
jgi:hypothetical protein